MANDTNEQSPNDEADTGGETSPPRERMIETQQEIAAQLIRIADALESDE